MMAEAYARSFDLPVVILRPFNTYGPRQSERAVIPTVIRQALDPDCAEIQLGDTETRRDFTYVGDMADAFMRAGSKTGLDYGRAYNAGSGDSVTIGAMAETVRTLVGTDKPVARDAERLRPEASEVRVLRADPARFAATGWLAATGLARGLSQTIDWWRARLAGGQVRPGAGYMV
jgi:UDP-glucose 4-epimerase